MTDSENVAERGAEAHERFVRENREIDLAWKVGKLDEWIEEKLANERRDGIAPSQ